jgi:hypothetical protein
MGRTSTRHSRNTLSKKWPAQRKLARERETVLRHIMISIEMKRNYEEGNVEQNEGWVAKNLFIV